VAIAGVSFAPETAGHPPSIVFSGTADQVLPYQSQKDSCDRSRAAGNVCEQVTYEGGDHYIPGVHGDDIKARAAQFVFEQALWPLGYRAEVMDVAA
jgi:predicted esterase